MKYIYIIFCDNNIINKNFKWLMPDNQLSHLLLEINIIILDFKGNFQVCISIIRRNFTNPRRIYKNYINYIKIYNKQIGA